MGEKRCSFSGTRNFHVLRHIGFFVLFIGWLMGSLFSMARSFATPFQEPIYSQIPTEYDKALEALANEEYAEAEAILRRFIDDHPAFQEPSGRSAWHRLGEALLGLQEPYSAVQVLEQGKAILDSVGIADLYLNYDLARLIGERRFEERFHLITPLLYEVFRNIELETQPDLWQRLDDELAFMMTKDARHTLKQASNLPVGEAGFIYIEFFRDQDPNPITLENEMFERLFHRSAVARSRYGTPSSARGYDSRGDIFVRLGQPQQVYQDHGGILGEMGRAIQPFEVWFYTHIDVRIYFTFVQKRGPGTFGLVPGPESVFGTFYSGHRAFGGRTVISPISPGAKIATIRLMLYESLAPIHDTFRQRVDGLREQISAQEAASYAARNFPADDAAHFASLDTLAPAFSFYSEDVAENLPLTLRVLRFAGEDGNIRAETTFSVPNSVLFFERSGSGFVSRLTGEIGLFDDAYDLIASDDMDMILTLESEGATEEGVFLSQWNRDLADGKYHLYFRLKNEESGKQALIRTSFELEPFPGDSLNMSNIQLARQVEPGEGHTPFHKKGLFIKPLLDYTFPQESRFFVYFELYNLSQDRGGHTRYQVTYTLEKEERKRGFLGVRGKTQTVQVFEETETLEGSAEETMIHRPFGFRDIPPGPHTFRITVTDLLTGRTTTEEEPVVLIE